MGSLEVKIDLDSSILGSGSLAFIRSSVMIWSLEKGFYDSVPVTVGESQTIPLREGEYKVQAILGKINSEEATADIRAGQTEKITFFFGRKT